MLPFVRLCTHASALLISSSRLAGRQPLYTSHDITGSPFTYYYSDRKAKATHPSTNYNFVEASDIIQVYHTTAPAIITNTNGVDATQKLSKFLYCTIIQFVYPCHVWYCESCLRQYSSDTGSFIKFTQLNSLLPLHSQAGVYFGSEVCFVSMKLCTLSLHTHTPQPT